MGGREKSGVDNDGLMVQSARQMRAFGLPTAVYENRRSGNLRGTKYDRPVYSYVMTIAREARLDDQVVDESEHMLVARARRGDQAAWSDLVSSHQEHIFRLAYLVLRDTAEAEDVAQETFVRAFLALDDFDTGRPLRPWLTRIAVNLARNRRRALGRYLNQLRRLLNKEPEPERTTSGPENTVQARWQANNLWTAVQRLSQIRQEVIYLRYFLAMSEADMAQALQVPPGTVKSRLHRALAELRKIIKADFPELQKQFIEE